MRKINKEECVAALSSTITPEDQVVVIHANIFSFGHLENITNEFLDIIGEVIGPDRTLLMPTFSFSFFNDYRFHYRDTPSNMGALSEAFRTLKGVARTPCPINSYAVRGPKSHLFLKPPSGDTCWGPGSVFETLYKCNALVIGFGEPLAKSASIFHHAEEIVGVPYRYFKTVIGQADFGNGYKNIRRRFYARRLDLPVEYSYEMPVSKLRDAGRVSMARLGMGIIETCRAMEAVDCLVSLLKKDPLTLLTNRESYEDYVSRKSFCFLGSTNLDFMAQKFETEYLALLNKACRITKMPFGQSPQQLLNPESNLRVTDPNYVIFLERVEELLEKVVPSSSTSLDDFSEVEGLVHNAIDRYVDIINKARSHLTGRFFVANFESLTPTPWGNADIQVAWGQHQIIKNANHRLAERLAELPDTFLLDYQRLVKVYGAQEAWGKKYWYLGRIPFSQAFSVGLSRAIIGLSLAAEGQTVRLIVLDLDDTLWGGIVGDDGLAALQLGGDFPGNMFQEWQRFLKSLTIRGIALAICSKNQTDVALKAISEHPNMVLHKEDFAALRINWEEKSINILSICREINLNPASVMFIDDNLLEREKVRLSLPECIVPEMPVDVSQWIPFLAYSPHLQTLKLTTEDMTRTRTYAQSAELRKSSANFTNIEDYLRTLEMKIELSHYQSSNQARILQLIAKTNQFNATTRRYSEGELARLIKEKKALVLSISLQDKWLQKEILGTVILIPDGLFYRIDSFILSCRVLGRNVEHAVLEWIIDQAKRSGYSSILGEIIPTDRNIPIRSLYLDHGFEHKSENKYHLDISKPREYVAPDYIQIIFIGDEMK